MKGEPQVKPVILSLNNTVQGYLYLFQVIKITGIGHPADRICIYGMFIRFDPELIIVENRKRSGSALATGKSRKSKANKDWYFLIHWKNIGVKNKV
jgi:hypothetical protein